MSKLVKFGDYLCGVDNPLLRWNGVKRCLDVTHNDDSNDYSDDRRARQYHRHLSSVSACSRYDSMTLQQVVKLDVHIQYMDMYMYM